MLAIQVQRVHDLSALHELVLAVFRPLVLAEVGEVLHAHRPKLFVLFRDLVHFDKHLVVVLNSAYFDLLTLDPVVSFLLVELSAESEQLD